MGKVIFSVCLLVHPGGRVPTLSEVPTLARSGGYLPWPGGGGNYPGQVQMGVPTLAGGTYPGSSLC